MNVGLHRKKSLKLKQSNGFKKPKDLRGHLLIASVFVPLGVEIIRLIEELTQVCIR
jgi:hypothetical protein